MSALRPSTPEEYFKAVHQLRQFLSESDSSERSMVRSGIKKDGSWNQQPTELANPCSPLKFQLKSPGRRGGEALNNEYLLIGLIQRQSLYIKDLEKELSYYRKEIQAVVNGAKLLISNEESLRMDQANNVTQRLFSLIDMASGPKLGPVSHESCETQRKKLAFELAAAQQQIKLLNQQWSDHACWNDPAQSKLSEDPTREKVELVSMVNKLRSTVSGLQQREADALLQVQQSVEVAEQAQLERAQMESEVRRLVSLVEQHEQQISSLSADHSRRLQEERTRWEAKLSEQAGAMKRDRELRDEALTRLSLDLEQSQRNEAILKNEIKIKVDLLDCSRQDYQKQIALMQSEHNRLVGQQAELQRRLGETELRADLNCKAAEQEATASRTECEFLRRKIGLLEKETETLKQDYERTIKDLEQRNMEMHVAASHRETERAQAVKSSSQASSLVKYLEQRELALLHSLEEERKTNVDKCGALSNIITEQRSIIQKLQERYATLAQDFQKCVSGRS